MKRLLLFLSLSTMLVGCASIRCIPLEKGCEHHRIVIVDNPEVVMKDVGPRLETEFRSRGFNVVQSCTPSAKEGDLIVTFTAKRGFNLWVPYPWLTYFRVDFFDMSGRPLACGTYKQRLGLLTIAIPRICRCSRSKLQPLFAELMANYPRTGVGEF